MSGRLTLWGASQLHRTFFTGTVVPPTSFWLALIRTTPPTPYMSGAEIDEPDQVDNPDYGRVEIPNDPYNWSNDSSPELIFNLLETPFVTASSDWGIISYWALCTDQFEGNNYVVGDLESPITVTEGIQPVLRQGDLSITLGPFYLVEEE